jgi:hypothetical protein
LWLKAYGVGAVCVPGPKSWEFWKNMRAPQKFDGLPLLWEEDDTRIFAIPRKSLSLAHAVPESAIVRARPRDWDDVAAIERYVAALEDSSVADPAFRWEGNNRIVIGAQASQPDAISVQVSWHPGWHATVAGRNIPLVRDGLGLMWMKPQCAGPCEIQLDYDGGWQLRLLRWLSFAAMAVLVGGLGWIGFRKRLRIT